MTGHDGPPVNRRTTTIRAVFQKSSLHVTLLVNNIPTDFLVDTGAEISVLPEGHAAIPPNSQLQYPPLQPIAVDGTPLDVTGTLVLSIIINDSLMNVTFYIIRSMRSPILGSDVLKMFHHVSLDYVNLTVRFGDHQEVNSEGKSGVSHVCHVVLQDHLTIPPMHEVVVSGILEDKEKMDSERISDKEPQSSNQ